MKQFFRFFAVLFMTVFASASSWAQTDPSSCAIELTVDAEVYIYNVGTGKYITKGEAWGTQAIVGEQPMLYKVQHPTGLDDGVYYLYSDETGKSSKIMKRVASDGKSGSNAVFVDGGTGEGSQIKITAVTGNMYTFQSAVDVPAGALSDDLYYGVNTAHASVWANNNGGTTWGIWYDCNLTDQGDNCLWMFIDPTALNAIDLKNALDEAKALNLDVTAEQAVYDDRANKSATEIADATKSLQNKIGMAKASAENPFNVANMYLADPSFASQKSTGWTSTFTVQNNMTWKTSANDNEATTIGTVAKGGIYNHFPMMEFWDGSAAKAVGKVYFTAGELPAGIYKFSMMAFVNKWDADNATTQTQYIYFGDKKYLLTKGQATAYGEFFELTEPMTGVEIGFEQTAAIANWIGLDEVELTYYANDYQAYVKEAEKLLPEGWENWEEDYAGQFAQPYFDALYEAADAIAGATDKATAKAAYLQTKDAVEAFYKNIELVSKLQDSYAVYEENHNNLGESRAGDPAVDPCNALLDTADGWIMAIDDADDEAMQDITNEAIEKWFADWAIAFEDCKQFSLTDIKEGVEGNCNILLQHPGFKDDMGNYTTAGWTITGTAPNFFQGFPLVAEVWAANFDASQTVKLPHDGAYSLHTHGFYRCGNTDVAWQRWQAAGNQETQNLTGANAENTCRAYLYADNLTERFSNTFHTIYTRAQVEALAATVYTSDFLDKYITGKNNGSDWAKSGNGPLTETFDECITAGRTNPYDFSFNLIASKETVQSDPDIPALIPNGVYSAHAVFTDPTYGPDYNMAINFLGRKDQVVRVGVKAENIQAQGWTIFEPFKLTWYGKDVPRLVEVMEKVLNQANTLAAEPMQKDSLAALTNGLFAALVAINSADGEALLNAYDAIVAAMGPAEKSRDAYIPLVEKKAELDTAIETYKETAMEAHLATATALQTEVAAAIAGGTIEDADIAAKVEEMALAIKHLPISKNPGDFTGVITNPTYCVNDAASLSGWSFNETNTETKALAPNAQLNSVGGVNMGIVEGWNGSEFNFNIWQDLDGLPQGYYLVTLQAAFRPFANDISLRRMGLAATADAPVTSLEGVTKLYSEIADSLTYMYANDETAIFQSLYILPTDERDLAQWADNNGGTDSWWTGGTYKNEQEEDVEYFVQLIGDEQTPAQIPGNRPAIAYRFGTRHYLATDDEFPSGDFFFTNKLTVYVGADGNLRIGVRNDNAAGMSWSPFTNWHLYYCGTEGVNPTGINELSDNTAKTVKTTVYSIDGRQMNGTVRGVNIVKTRDNNGKETVRKVIVK